MLKFNCRVTLTDWELLRGRNEPKEFFSTSIFTSVFRHFTEFQNVLGNRIVLMNCNRIRDASNHAKVKEDILQLLVDKHQDLSLSSFHAVRLMNCCNF